jgi:peptidoglycan/xylan/chitin deacetylase (PgdA/CDA1 family)
MKGKREAAARVFEGSGLGWLLRRLGVWRGLLILNYHRLARAAEEVLDAGVWSATPEAFEAQVRLLRRETDLLAPGEVEAALDRPGRQTLLTFDDGYRDNYTLAFPLLRACGAAAVFFPVTGYLDAPRLPGWDEIGWILAGSPAEAIRAECRRFRTLSPADGEPFLDDLAARSGRGRAPAELSRDLWLTWEMVREMDRGGMAFGGHTHRHVCLSTLDAAGQAAEINGCLQRLAAELGHGVAWFSYPFGARESFDGISREVLRAAGVKLACSQYGGWQRPGAGDALNLLRQAVDRTTAPCLFRASLAWPGWLARA